METAALPPLQHPKLTKAGCQLRADQMQEACKALENVISCFSETAQGYWQERLRELEANRDYWHDRVSDRGRA